MRRGYPLSKIRLEKSKHLMLDTITKLRKCSKNITSKLPQVKVILCSHHQLKYYPFDFIRFSEVYLYFHLNYENAIRNYNKKTLCVVTIAIICSKLASL